MQLPQAFVETMKRLLGNEFSAFEQALIEIAPTSVRINNKGNLSLSDVYEPVVWCPKAYYLTKRPVFTADPLFHAGAYYVQEASSMFLYQAVKQHFSDAKTILDLCAAPGGKSTLLLQHLSHDSLLISNELVRNRANILSENLQKWGNANIILTSNKPQDFDKLSGFFDAMVIDAPCSGEGMFRKDENAIAEWSSENVKMCAERQKTIVADVWNALKTNGICIYSTCTYNRQENEDNVAWVCQTLGAKVLKINISAFPEIVETENGYRFFPHHTRGEGFYLSVLQKTAENDSLIKIKTKNSKLNKIKLSDFTSARLLLQQNFDFILKNNELKAYISERQNEILFLEENLNVLFAGLTVGERKSKDFVPSQQLALAKDFDILSINSQNVDYQTAINFLKREILFLENAPKTYILLKYNDIPLGWVKNVGNRCNNLYPDHWRIRMTTNQINAQKYSLF